MQGEGKVTEGLGVHVCDFDYWISHGVADGEMFSIRL